MIIKGFHHEVLGIEIDQCVQQNLRAKNKSWSKVNRTFQNSFTYSNIYLWAPNCFDSHKCSSSILVTKYPNSLTGSLKSLMTSCKADVNGS